MEVRARGRRRALAAIATVCAGAVSLTACSSGSSSGGGSDPLTIGVIQPLTGAAALSAKEIVNGITMAVDKINAAGGVDGHKLEIKTYDTKLDAATSVTVFTQAVSQAKAVGIIGPYATSEVQAVTPAALRLKTPLIGPTVSTTSVTNGDGTDYVFRSGVVNKDVTAKNIAVAKSLNCTKPALLHDDGGYGKDYQKGISEQIAPLTLAATETFPVAATDVTAQVQSVKASGADCVFVGGSGGASVGLVIKTMAQVGLSVPVIGPDSLITADTRRVAGDSIAQMKGVYADQALDTSKQSYKDLLAEYQKTFNSTPVAAFWVSAYDATNLMAKGLEKSGGKGGEDLKKGLEQLTASDYDQVYGAEGATGGYSASDHNWLHGNYLLIYKVSPTSAEPDSSVG